MRNSAIVKLVLGACALGGLGCTGSQAPVTPDAKVSVTVAALDLPLMSDA